MTKKTAENSKGKFQKPKVKFSKYEIGKNIATQADVIFEGPEKTLRVSFYGDLEFSGMSFNEKKYKLVMCADIYEKDNKDPASKEELIASDKYNLLGPETPVVEMTAGEYNYMAQSFSRYEGYTKAKDPFIKYMQNASFEGNSDNLNEFIKYAQEQVIEEFPEFDKQRRAAEQKAKEESELQAINENKDLGQRLFDEYLPGLAEDKRAQIEEEVKNSRLGKIGKRIDDRYGTHLVANKVERKLKRQVAQAARKDRTNE